MAQKINIDSVMKGFAMECVALCDDKNPFLPKVYASDGLKVKVSESFRKTLKHKQFFSLRVIDANTKIPSYSATNVFEHHEN